MSSEAKWILGIVAVLLVVFCCLTAFCVVGGGLAFWSIGQSVEHSGPEFFETGQAPLFQSPTATLEPLPDQEPVGDEALSTLDLLENEIVPVNNMVDLAERLEGKENVPDTLPASNTDLDVGVEQQFWVSNTDTNENFQITATLRYKTPHLYFWIENGVSYDEKALSKLCDTFEDKIYVTDREFFGSEWTPGVDDDPHLYVVYAGDLGFNLAGYFSSSDEVHPLADQYSNAHEMFLMNSDNVGLGEAYIYGTMAHEFQHMIHWYGDRNEESWLNEGFSMLAELLNGYDTGGFDSVYVMDPDMQLTTWSSGGSNSAHYGASFLFVSYFLDRFGEEATKAVVRHPDNGMDSIDAVLSDLGLVDPLTGQTVRADDIFADWVVTNYLNDSEVGDGRFAYQLYRDAPSAGNTERFSDCPVDWQTRQVAQYGVDYIHLDCSGTYTLSFQGATEVNLLPVGPASGDFAYWSNYGDESDMTLTRTFDFSDVTGPLTLVYSTWYDLEEDYDYAYVEVSEDGKTWQILKTPSSTDYNPSGNNYGWGYNGQSAVWVEEQVDLSDYAGKQIQVRFEYITDDAVNGEGMLLDDVSVPEIGYNADFEQDDGGWDGEGFVRIQNRLPQTFEVSVIRHDGETTVERMTLDDQQRGELTLDLGDGAVLVVSGTTRFTLSPASYRFEVVK